MSQDRTDIQAIALLDEPARRALYDAVAAARHPLSRDEAAAGAGVSRALAAFHLDKLVGAGLLDVEYRRLSGRTGPGAGRPSKLYRRSSREHRVSLPDRHYEVPAELLATALEQLAGPTPTDGLRAAAHEAGEEIGAAARQRSGPRPSRRRLRAELEATLEARGYEPAESNSGEIRFRNCPFHALVEEHRGLVCNMNLALADGILDGLGDDRLSARLDPQPGQCCVAISSDAQAHRRSHVA
ncbi:MAG TPA: helix-turn-helix domain-containing protein [Candidatus Limnocylindrales bacterium]|nr:helix-turn-helix domain-containing protein [Candidatus Limnocylindrales bacterium]